VATQTHNDRSVTWRNRLLLLAKHSGLLGAAHLLGAAPALLHLLSAGGGQLDQAQARLAVLGLKALKRVDVVVNQAEASGLAAAELRKVWG